MSRQRRRAAQEAELAMSAQMFISHTPQTQFKVVKTRAKSVYKATHTKFKRLVSARADSDDINSCMLTLNQHLKNYADAVHDLVAVTDDGKVEALLAEIELATDEVGRLEDQLLKEADSQPSRSRSGSINSLAWEHPNVEVSQTNEPHQEVQQTVEVESASSEKPLSHAAPMFRPNVKTIASHLSRIKIPSFSGKKRRYPEWRAVFDNCVDADVISAEMKLLYLRDSLEGEALKSINGLGYSAHAYEAAKEILEREYGGARRLTAIRLEELERFRSMKEPSAKEVKQFSSLLNLLVTNLREEGKGAELEENSTLYQQALKKLPEQLIVQYKRWVENGHHQESIVIETATLFLF